MKDELIEKQNSPVKVGLKYLVFIFKKMAVVLFANKTYNLITSKGLNVFIKIEQI